METAINLVATVLSQIFVGMVLGFCWNNSMTELGLNPFSAVGAISAWFGFLFAFAILTYVFVNMFKNAMYTGVVAVDAEKPKPPDDDISAV
jgi:hypothetical protein